MKRIVWIFILLFACFGCRGAESKAEIAMEDYEGHIGAPQLCVTANGKTMSVELTDRAYGATVQPADLDGDGTDEFVTMSWVGGTGGYGWYLLGVYRIRDGELVKLQDGEDMYVPVETEMALGRVVVKVPATGYTKVMETVDPVMYEEWDCPSMNLDSFCTFEPAPEKGAGVWRGRQFMWCFSHASRAGDLMTYWKWIGGRFVLIDAEIVES